MDSPAGQASLFATNRSTRFPTAALNGLVVSRPNGLNIFLRVPVSVPLSRITGAPIGTMPSSGNFFVASGVGKPFTEVPGFVKTVFHMLMCSWCVVYAQFAELELKRSTGRFSPSSYFPLFRTLWQKNWINRALRNRQRLETVVAQTQIRQFYRTAAKVWLYHSVFFRTHLYLFLFVDAIKHVWRAFYPHTDCPIL